MARKQSRRKAVPAKRKAKARAKASAPSRQKLKGELNYLEKRLDALMKAARGAEASVRAGTLEQLGALQKKQAAAKQALARLARQSAAAGGPIASGLQKAWRDIDLAVRQATRRFRETT
jgi:hypothetical protein